MGVMGELKSGHFFPVRLYRHQSWHMINIDHDTPRLSLAKVFCLSPLFPTLPDAFPGQSWPMQVSVSVYSLSALRTFSRRSSEVFFRSMLMGKKLLSHLKYPKIALIRIVAVFNFIPTTLLPNQNDRKPNPPLPSLHSAQRRQVCPS